MKGKEAIDAEQKKKVITEYSHTPPPRNGLGDVRWSSDEDFLTVLKPRSRFPILAMDP